MAGGGVVGGGGHQTPIIKPRPLPAKFKQLVSGKNDDN